MSSHRSYSAAAARLDEHMASCRTCGADGPCSEGDAVAEAEFRSWRELQRSDPGSAQRQQARWSSW